MISPPKKSKMSAGSEAMYFIVNADVVKQMGIGKTAAQVAHAAIDANSRSNSSSSVYQHWKRDGRPKIVLKAPESVLRSLISKYPERCCPIFDAGLTKVDAGTLTVVGITIASDQIKELSQLKLL